MPSGQAIGDLLAGAAGVSVNRPALDAAVMQGQAMAGLRTAQTEDALLSAQQAQEEMDARAQLEDAFTGMKDAQGNPMMTGSQAHLAAIAARAAHGGNALQALQAVREAQGNQAFATVANPNADPNARLAANQALNPAENPYQAVGDQLIPRFGATSQTGAPAVNQTPVSAANVGDKNADAALKTAEATNPSAFHPGAANPLANDPELAQEVAKFIQLNPNLATNMRALLSNGGPQVIRAFLGMQGGGPQQPQGDPNEPQVTPPNGITPAPGVSLKEQADIRNDFAKGTAAKQVTPLNTMVLHSMLFDQIADQMGNGNFSPTNEINQLWQRAFGSPAPANLATAGSFLGREAVRATVNSGSGTGAERELQVGPNASPDQLHGVAQTLRALAAGQLQSLDLRARRGGVDINQLLGPEARAAFGRQPTGPDVVPPTNTHSTLPGAVSPTGAPDPLGIR